MWINPLRSTEPPALYVKSMQEENKQVKKMTRSYVTFGFKLTVFRGSLYGGAVRKEYMIEA